MADLASLAPEHLEWQRNTGARKDAARSERLFRIRHSCSHILAQAVLELFPTAKLTIGPPISTGFYYDFDMEEPLTNDDLERIEEAMRKIIKKKTSFYRSALTKEEAKPYFDSIGQPYKLELMDDIKDDVVGLYKQDTFVDLCAGPHVGNTKECKHFKLLNVAGAYWRGDENKPQLQRVYGTAWEKAEELERYLQFLEDSKKRDHRYLGPKLELFFFHEWSPGNCFWQPHGLMFLEQLRKYSKELHDAAGYEEISNPIIYKKELFETSGHWQYYKDDMFHFQEDEHTTYAIKPMNCPDTMLYYKHRTHSYRELPLRVAERQVLHRNEATGTLHGLLRARAFTQDDAHIFVTGDQITDEIINVIEMVEQVYGLFEMTFAFTLSTKPEKAMGDPKLWEKAEDGLREAFKRRGIDYALDEGGGAFYGPKIDIKVTDALGRVWQTATIQLDFQLPERFELEYIGADNTPHRPIVIHRAIFGSVERFAGILLEHLGGAFPTWMAPEQVRILSITDDQIPFVEEAVEKFKAAGVRVTSDTRGEKVNYKIREAEVAHVPYMLVAGKREAEAGTLAVRTFQGGQQGVKPIDEIIAEITDKVANRELDVTIESYADLFEEDAPDNAPEIVM